MSTKEHHPIVVGVDGSPPSVEATRWAAAEAALHHRELHLVHAYTWPAAAVAFAAPVYGWTEATAREQAEEIVAAAVAVARAAAPHLTVTGRSVYGPVAETLIELSRDAALVVVGDRGHGGFASLLLGSVASTVAAHASSSVAVVRSVGAGSGIVVGVDGSPAADAALGFALEEAARRAEVVQIVHSWEAPVPNRRPGLPPVPHYLDELQTAHARLVQDWARPWREKYPDVPVEVRLTGQRPGPALVGASMGAALVVVASRGRGGFTGLLLGSVSQQVIHHAACPVVVAR